MKRVKHYAGLFLCLCLLILNVEIKAQAINGDTIYVDANTLVALRFPSKLTDYYTNPPDALYNLITLSTGLTIIAKKKGTAPAELVVIENKRTHKFIVVNRKDVAGASPKQTDYDFSTVKKLKERVKELEEREKKYNVTVAEADKYYNTEDYENAKIFYTTAIGILNRPWPKEQLAKVNKQLKKKKHKKN